MLFASARNTARRLAAPVFWIVFVLPALAAPTGPTLQFDYFGGQGSDSSLSKFMYFVPLISPENVLLATNVANTQSARVISCRCRTNGAAFRAECEFEFDGDGLERNAFDHDFVIKHRQSDLKAGRTLAHQLAAISVQGGGLGSIDVEGVFTNGRPVVTEVRIHFNGHNHPSPVSVDLVDMVMRDGAIHLENAMVARVNSLTFRQKSDPPKMEVSLASVKRKDAGSGVWVNFVAGM